MPGTALFIIAVLAYLVLSGHRPRQREDQQASRRATGFHGQSSLLVVSSRNGAEDEDQRQDAHVGRRQAGGR
jgi:hypothetical protein